MASGKLTSETKTALRVMKAAGRSYNEIADRTGVSAKYLAEVAAEMGLSRHQFEWTEERETQLRELWAIGKTSGAIARALGGGVTRSAICGKVRRLNLPMRVSPNPSYRSSTTQTKMQRRAAAAKKGRRTRERFDVARAEFVAGIIVPPEEAPLGATPLVDSRNDQCRWPYGDGPYVFCPEVKVPGLSYCLGHAAKSTNSVQPVRKAAQQ